MSQEYYLAEVQKTLDHIEVNALIGDIFRLGREQDKDDLLESTQCISTPVVVVGKKTKEVRSGTLCQSTIDRSRPGKRDPDQEKQTD